MLLTRVIAEDNEVQISSKGDLNADINLDGSVGAVDSAELLLQLADL